MSYFNCSCGLGLSTGFFFLCYWFIEAHWMEQVVVWKNLLLIQCQLCMANIWEIWQLFERLIELSTIFPLKYSGYFPFKTLFWFPYRYLYVLNRKFPLTWKCFLYTTTRIGQTAMIVKFWTALGIVSRTLSVVRKTKTVRNIVVGGVWVRCARLYVNQSLYVHK